MLRILLSNGKRRRLLVEEAARLQSFPDWYKFYGNDTSIFNQIGNSVPPLLSFYISKSILKSLDY
jgi:DNA (cytosine-5)-methyltransferase 1